MAQAQGIVSGIYEANNGWHDIRLEGDDRKYSTKKQDLVGSAKELRDRLVTIEYSVKANGEYTNYYLDKIEAAATLDAELAAGTAGINGNGSKTKMPMDPQERAEMRRSVALKAAADLAPHLFKKTDEAETNQMKLSNIVTAAQFLEQYIERGADSVLAP